MGNKDEAASNAKKKEPARDDRIELDRIPIPAPDSGGNAHEGAAQSKPAADAAPLALPRESDGQPVLESESPRSPLSDGIRLSIFVLGAITLGVWGIVGLIYLWTWLFK